ncbi:hypothetical protein [Actinopolymorpha rutila]|uniref:Cell division septum initiation protein DivIVA n=1 Tax=Actinopolymorpha rutila TaxID=446787 RepID=A0A852ZAU9_9ACTN|nr:hypothetical protein [Actinopolymorpha rutila]NYH89335.1 cell division septum initiation protein DivIVA [Actinopolymorpha rutila]
MDVQHKLDELRRMVQSARSVPLSASCLVNRTELLAGFDEAQRMLPQEFETARKVAADRDAVVAGGRAEADRLVEEARRQRAELVERTDIHREARTAADELTSKAQEEADGLRREVDDYVDGKLAGFEIALQKTLTSVSRGREELRSRGPNAGRGGGPKSPAEVDEYVETKLGKFEESLRRTLDSVTRGRERLRDRSSLDDTFAGGDPDGPPLPGE